MRLAGSPLSIRVTILCLSSFLILMMINIYIYIYIYVSHITITPDVTISVIPDVTVIVMYSEFFAQLKKYKFILLYLKHHRKGTSVLIYKPRNKKYCLLLSNKMCLFVW